MNEGKPPEAIFVGSEQLWERGHPPGHPLRPERLRDTWEMLLAYDAFAPAITRVEPPRMATDEDLTTFHIAEYVEVVRRLSRGEVLASASRYGFGPGDNPVFEGMYESEGLKVGAALVATEALLAGTARIAFSYAGGLHHAGRDFASGFCVFGDGAIAILRLRSHGWRVAYVDIDAHHGDGVQTAFYDDPGVLTISLHESGRFIFPGTGFPHELGEGAAVGTSVNVPLYPYTDDDTFLWAYDRIVPPLVRAFAPDVVVAQLGVDAHWRDPLTHLALTTHGFEALFHRIGALSPRLLALGGGGYERDIVPRAWTLAWGVMSGQSFPDELPPSIAAAYDAPWLHDRGSPAHGEARRRQARAAAEQVVRGLEARLGLS